MKSSNISNSNDDDKLEKILQILSEISANEKTTLDLSKKSSENQDHFDIIKDVFEGQRTLFNYDFEILSHINQKIYNLLTFILITQGIIGLLINAIIEWQGGFFQTLFLIIPLFFSGIFLTISGYYIVGIMKPRKIMFPEFTSELKTSNKNEFYRDEILKIVNARHNNKILFDENSNYFMKINNYIIISIVLLLVASVFSIILFVISLLPDYSICNIFLLMLPN